MPALTRDLAITYGGMAVGAATSRLIHGPWQFRRSYTTGTLTFQLLIAASSNSAFVTERNAVEVAFSTPRGALLVTLGGNTHLDLDPADFTGFNATSEIAEVAGSPYNTSRSRLYDVTISVELPADLSGQSGLGECRISRSYTPARKATITLEGFYTAVASGTVNARDQYDASKAGLFTTKSGASDLDDSATYEKTFEEASTNDTNTRCTFRLVYEEVIVNQSVGTLNDSEICKPSLKITRSQSSENSPEDKGAVTGEPANARTPGGPGPGKAKPPVTLTAVFECWIDKTASTNPQVKWTSKVRPWVLQQIRTHAVNGQLAVVEESPSFDRYENKITATVRAVAFGTKLITFSIETEDTTDDGQTIAPVWSSDPLDAYVFQRPAVVTRMVTRSSLFTGSVEDPQPKVETLKQGPGWIPVGPRRSRRRRLKVGLEGDTVDCTDLVESFAMRFVKKPTTGGGGEARK